MIKNTIYLLLGLALCACNTQKQPKDKSAELWLTSLDGSTLLEKTDISNQLSEDNSTVIAIDSSKTFQTMDGFGYTLTGGSAMHIQKMSTQARADLLQEFFGNGEDEIGISYLRVSLGASDLDEKLWSYNDLKAGEEDLKLEQFSLDYDTLYLIPVLKDILKINPNIKIMGSPWSPPVWMKTNEDTRGGSLNEKYHQVYADYFVKYIKAMAQEGIPIDAITVQNEPLHPGNNPSLLMYADQQASFIKDFLGPTFRRNKIDTKIIVYDHNADRIDYPISILNDPEAAQYIDGSAFHLYGGQIDALSKVHQAHPDKNLYFTEQWVGAPANFENEMEWHTENLIIGATRNWCKTVLEWNLASDENQEPHTDRGGCDRCLGAVTISGDKIIRNPAYYIIAQASKFVPAGSKRISSSYNDSIPNVSFKRLDGKIVTIILNKTTNPQHLSLQAQGKTIDFTLKERSVGTLIM